MITIYALTDPHDGAVRYVGKTKQSLRARFRAHINRAPKQPRIKSAVWISGLLLAGLKPGIFVLETVDSSWEAAERFWVASFRIVGADLLNMTKGGGGTPGYCPSAEVRAKISAAAKKQFADPQRRLAAAEYGRQPWQDLRFREAKLVEIRQRALDPAQRENQSAKKKERWLDPDYRNRILQTKKETGCHINGALKMWSRPEYRQLRDAQIDAKCAVEGRVRGVCFDARRSKWVAQAKHAGRHHQKRFDTYEMAVAAITSWKAIYG